MKGTPTFLTYARCQTLLREPGSILPFLYRGPSLQEHHTPRLMIRNGCHTIFSMTPVYVPGTPAASGYYDRPRLGTGILGSWNYRCYGSPPNFCWRRLVLLSTVEAELEHH